MDIKTFASSSNAVLIQKQGSSTSTAETGALNVSLCNDGTLFLDFSGSTFQVIEHSVILFESQSDFKRTYHFVLDPAHDSAIIIKVNDNFDSVHKILEESSNLVPYSATNSPILRMGSFKSVQRPNSYSSSSIKFTQSITLGGSAIPKNSQSLLDSSKIVVSVPNTLTTSTKPQPVSSHGSGDCLKVLPDGAKVVGNGLMTVGKTVGQTTGNLVGGVVGGLAGIGKGLFGGIKNGFTR